MPSVLKSSIRCQDILNSKAREAEYGTSYQLATVGNVWLSRKEIAEIERVGPDAICDLVASSDVPPRERIWAILHVRKPDT